MSGTDARRLGGSHFGFAHGSFAKSSSTRHMFLTDGAPKHGAYDTASWSVDRLHPSERGHRMLAAGFAGLLAGAGIDVPYPVDPACSGGRQLSALHHLAWLLLEGVPWLGRRGGEFLPHAAGLVLRALLSRTVAVPSRYVRR